jgi:hypothetical protein
MPIDPKVMKLVADRNVFHEGTKAYYDTFSGMIPCKILAIEKDCYGFHCGPYDVVKFQLTEDRGAYKKGEILTASASCVPPRKMVHTVSYHRRITTTYKYESNVPCCEPIQSI